MSQPAGETHAVLSVPQILANTPYRPWILNKRLRKLYFALIPACIFVCATNGFDGSMINGIQAVKSWQDSFNHPSGAILGFMAACYPLGAVLSTPFAPPIADRFGRRWSVFIGSVIMCIGVALQTASNTVAFFCGARVVVGFGITMALAAAPVLISELAHPQDRVIFTAIYGTSFYLGAVPAAWVTYGTFRIPNSWGWRIPSILQAVPAIIQVIFIFMLPESPRWLVYKDRHEEALNIFVKYHGMGSSGDELAQAEYFEVVETLRIEKEARAVGLKLFFQTRGNMHRLAILITFGFFGQWSGNGLVSYYLAKILTSIGITGQSEQNMINGVLTTVNYVTGVFAAFMTMHVDRRKMFMGGGIGMILFFSSLTIGLAVYNEKHSSAAGRAALGFIFIYYVAYNICLNATLYLYPSEVLPFRLRAMGMGVLVFSNKLALFLNQFVNPIGMDSLGWKYYLVYVGWLVVEVIVMYFLWPETRGYSLERVAEVFDGPAIKDALDTAVAKDMMNEKVHLENVEVTNVKDV
ncbi:general substrate transporter [Rhizodiscina lignyota]|uniref:General substrate transporter n=1 Tax=Rhizodiscina lignyota TaxID=1504668 RepID=A0A9P4I9F3_9PEZI|nr:general substrate transporter [Rhizodiscina lignyota]